MNWTVAVYINLAKLFCIGKHNGGVDLTCTNADAV